MLFVNAIVIGCLSLFPSLPSFAMEPASSEENALPAYSQSFEADHLLIDEKETLQPKFHKILNELLHEHYLQTHQEIRVVILSESNIHSEKDIGQIAKELFGYWVPGTTDAPDPKEAFRSLIAISKNEVKIEVGESLIASLPSEQVSIIEKKIEKGIRNETLSESLTLAIVDLLTALQSPTIVSGQAYEKLAPLESEEFSIGDLNSDRFSEVKFLETLLLFLWIPSLLLLVFILLLMSANNFHYSSTGYYKVPLSLLFLWEIQRFGKFKTSKNFNGSQGSWY